MKGIRLLPVLGALLLVLTACASPKGELQITENGKAGEYEMVFSGWNGQKQMEIPLEAGDELQVEVLWEQGEVSLGITHRDGAEVYRGRLQATGLFTVTVAQEGGYGIDIAGSDATGRVFLRNLGSGR